MNVEQVKEASELVKQLERLEREMERLSLSRKSGCLRITNSYTGFELGTNSEFENSVAITAAKTICFHRYATIKAKLSTMGVVHITEESE